MKFALTKNSIKIEGDNGEDLGAVYENKIERGNSSYDQHRISKGDNFDIEIKCTAKKETIEAVVKNAKNKNNLHYLLRMAARDLGVF